MKVILLQPIGNWIALFLDRGHHYYLPSSTQYVPQVGQEWHMEYEGEGVYYVEDTEGTRHCYHITSMIDYELKEIEMPRTYGETEYKKKGEEKGLEFKGPLPQYVTQPTNWVCKNCGKEHHKAYRALDLREHGCICALSLQAQAYLDLAKTFEIEWVPENPGLIPTNTKTLTRWFSLKTGDVFEASYSDLKWRLTNALKEKIGMPTRKRGGRSKVYAAE